MRCFKCVLFGMTKRGVGLLIYDTYDAMNNNVFVSLGNTYLNLKIASISRHAGNIYICLLIVCLV